MKTTRMLGFWAGVTALIALVVLAAGAFLTMRMQLQDFLAFGMYILVAGVVLMVLSLLLGVAHLILRIRFRNPYRSKRRASGYLIAGRVLIWVWAVSLISIAVGASVWLLGPGKDYLSLLQLL